MAIGERVEVAERSRSKAASLFSVGRHRSVGKYHKSTLTARYFQNLGRGSCSPGIRQRFSHNKRHLFIRARTRSVGRSTAAVTRGGKNASPPVNRGARAAALIYTGWRTWKTNINRTTVSQWHSHPRHRGLCITNYVTTCR